MRLGLTPDGSGKGLLPNERINSNRRPLSIMVCT